MNRRIFLTSVSLALLLVSTQSFAQWVPPRSYWKPFNGMWAVPMLYGSFSGNVNPTDASYVVNPGVNFDAEVLQAGYY